MEQFLIGHRTSENDLPITFKRNVSYTFDAATPFYDPHSVVYDIGYINPNDSLFYVVDPANRRPAKLERNTGHYYANFIVEEDWAPGTYEIVWKYQIVPDGSWQELREQFLVVSAISGLTGTSGVDVSLVCTGAQGTPGGPGSTGTYRIPGPTGAQGITGIQGPQGETGLYAETGVFTITLGSGDNALTTNASTNVSLPYSLQFDNWRMLIGNGETGSISVSVQSGSYDEYPLSTNMPGGATGPFISNGWKNTMSTNSWAGTTGAFGDIVRFKINSTDETVTNISLSMFFHKTN